MEKVNEKLPHINLPHIPRVELPRLKDFIPKIHSKPNEINENIINLSNIYRNKSNIKIIIKFLNTFQLGCSKDTKGIILRGPIGCGKISLFKSCLASLGYEYQLYDTDYESEDIFDRLLVSIQTKSKQRKCIIIRDIDSALRNSQKSKFYKFLNNRTLPVLMTSHDVSVGTTREVPKCIIQLDFELLFLTDLVKIGVEIGEKDNMTVSKNAIEKIAKISNGDIRYLINQVHGMRYIEEKITVKNSVNHIKNFQYDTFNGIKYCGTQGIVWEDKVGHTSSYTNSTFFHNYPKLTSTKNFAKITDLICQAEELRNFAYSNQEWDTFESHYCILGTVIPMSLVGEISITGMSYPPSTLNAVSHISFEQLQEDSIMILKNISNFENIEDPIRACKLGMINQTSKNKESKLKELRKLIKVIEYENLSIE